MLRTTIDPDLLEWVKDRVGTGKRFANLSHAVESAIVLLQERVEREERALEADDES